MSFFFAALKRSTQFLMLITIEKKRKEENKTFFHKLKNVRRILLQKTGNENWSSYDITRTSSTVGQLGY